MKWLPKFKILALLCLIVVSCSATISKPEDCQASFDNYAYGGGTNLDIKIPLPASWQKIDDVPVEVSKWSWLEIELIRKVHNETEIWLKEPDSNIYTNSEAESYKYYVYVVEKKELRTITAVIPETGAFAMKLFLSRDGSIWAQNFWDVKDSTGNSSYYQKYPILSRFSDFKQVFEPIPETQRIDAFKETSWNKIIYVDNAFWIFAQADSIYKFDPVTSEIEKRLEIPDLEIQHIASSHDGNLIFLQTAKNDMSFSVTEGEYMQYAITENRLIPLPAPSVKWPASGSILVDHSGNLWLSAVGFYTPDGNWSLLYPNLFRYFWNMQIVNDYSFQLPTIVLESSDGRLWFQREKGIAWLDPKSMQGCWVTINGASDVMEDLDHTIWLISNGKLYKDTLKP